MVQIVVDIDTNTLPQLAEKIPLISKRGLNLTALGLIGELTRNSPFDEGLLRQWFIESQTDDEVHIKTPAEYAKYVNDGTGVYNGGGLITAKNGGPLVFKPGKKWNGPVIEKGKFKGLVVLKHSRGQPGQHFVEKSIDTIETQIGGYFKIAINEVLG